MTVCLIVPVFNEARRWDDNYWSKVAAGDNRSIVFVNDGSTDTTAEVLQQAADDWGAHILTLEQNVGKAEATRAGFLLAQGLDCDFIGLLDADGAFPVSEVNRIISLAEEMLPLTYESIWSSRVQLAGRNIERRLSRHYVARILLTLLALRFRFNVYDTQSGFKIFRADDRFFECVQYPFKTRWFVDLEMLLRWRQVEGSDPQIWEEPVLAWRDVAGSKLTFRQNLVVLKDLLRLVSAYESGSSRVKRTTMQARGR